MSIKCDNGGVKGEKEKERSGVEGEKDKGRSDIGAVGFVVGSDSSDGVCEKEKISKEKLKVYCRHLGDGRGECY